MKLFGKTKEAVKYDKLATMGTIGAVISGIVAIGTIIWANQKLDEKLEQSEAKINELNKECDELEKNNKLIKEFIEKRKEGVSTLNNSVSGKFEEFQKVLNDASEVVDMISEHDYAELYSVFDSMTEKISMFQEVCEKVEEVLSNTSLTDKERYKNALFILQDMDTADDEVDDDEEDEDERASD